MARPATDIRPRLVRAARERFSASGVDGASLREIAAAAGTSIGMVYNHFKTKDDLFLAVVEEVYGKVLADMEAALAPGPSVRERLRRLYRRLALVSDEELAVLRLVLREAMVSSTRLDRLMARFLRGHLPLVMGLIEEGVRDGTLDGNRPVPLMMMATFALAGPPQFVRRGLGGRTPLGDLPSGEALADQLVEILLGGMGARPGERRRRPVD
jgi:AcrR family transcriptional regulator